MRRVADNPPTRFPDRPIAAAEHPWSIIHVKPRMEKAIADDCVRLGIEYYLPMTTKITRRADNNKPRKSIVPLFSCYVSVAGTKETWHTLYKTGRVTAIIEVKHQAHFIKQLGQIYSLLEKGVKLESYDVPFEKGAEVEVLIGPFKGIVGTVLDARNPNKIVLEVSGLGQAVMSVDPAIVGLKQ